MASLLETQTQGLVINADDIVAFYPVKRYAILKIAIQVLLQGEFPDVCVKLMFRDAGSYASTSRTQRKLMFVVALSGVFELRAATR